MRKIPTLFVRDWDGNPRYVTREPDPECAWVFDGEGEATAKWDGICVGYLTLAEMGGAPAWYVRREVKPGQQVVGDFWPTGADEETGKTTGWQLIASSGFAKYHAEAVAGSSHEFAVGTYELIGPKINGNPEQFAGHVLMRHGWAPLSIREDAKTAPRDHDGLAVWLYARTYEGVVWHHPDGRRMAKVKRRDFPARQSGETPR